MIRKRVILFPNVDNILLLFTSEINTDSVSSMVYGRPMWV
jgi:hypothetical protein